MIGPVGLEIPEGCVYYKPEQLKDEHRARDGQGSYALIVGIATDRVATDVVVDRKEEGAMIDVTQRMGCRISRFQGPSEHLHAEGVAAIVSTAVSDETDFQMQRLYDGISQSAGEAAERSGVFKKTKSDETFLLPDEYFRNLDEYFVRLEQIQ